MENELDNAINHILRNIESMDKEIVYYIKDINIFLH